MSNRPVREKRGIEMVQKLSAYDGKTVVCVVDGDEARDNGHPPCELTLGPGLRVVEVFIPPHNWQEDFTIPIGKYEDVARKMVDDLSDWLGQRGVKALAAKSA